MVASPLKPPKKIFAYRQSFLASACPRPYLPAHHMVPGPAKRRFLVAVTKLGLLGSVSTGWGGSAMDARHLFQLGTTDLGSGAAQTEGMLGWGADDVEVIDTPRRDEKHSRTTNTNRRSTRLQTRRSPETQIKTISSVAMERSTPARILFSKSSTATAWTMRTESSALSAIASMNAARRFCISICIASRLRASAASPCLAESHISVHTWPERRYGAFDVFMCGDAEPHRAVPVLKEAFAAREVRVTELLRGDGIV